MPRKVSAQHREAILDAALECFSKRGFDATRVEDIARLAGVAKGSVYTHFKDKEALFRGSSNRFCCRSIGRCKRFKETKRSH